MGVCLLAGFLLTSPLHAEDKKPNIVFIFSDDHAWQAISAYGDARKLNQTPHIDRIAKEGMRFDRCLVPNAICGPSRATVLTGKYNHLNGFMNNANSKFDGSQMTFPKLLQAAGYQTALIGKWHLLSTPTGFDFWQILHGQGVYYNPPMIRNGTDMKFDGYVTDIITDTSVDWIKNRDKTKPFLLMCQQKAPHREWEPPVDLLGKEPDRVYPEPETLFDDYSGRGLAEHDQDMTIANTMNKRDLKLVAPRGLTDEQLEQWNRYYKPRNEKFEQANLSGKELVSWKYQRYMHDYLTCVEAVDDGVGKLLKTLDDEGLTDNTIVIYCSDQGFFLGEHGWFDKRWIFEESLRTPLLVRWPGHIKPGSVNNQMVSNLDFAETFLDAAGIEIPSEMQGRSLVNLMEGHTPEDWRKSFYYQYYEYPGAHHVRPHYGVVTDRYKLVQFYGTQYHDQELFDLQTDPHEMTNVIDLPENAEKVKELRAELARLRTEFKVPEVIPPKWFGNQRIDQER
ncbi:sulfatase [Luteolibacter pohnpeiensis]|uniref:Sulfatase n=2 Tax=Luteolibacter pohnpeiensis TaxID=454153 RepID=A0A934S6A2_9BACT|nr:sulfatase [Luteolibacter pohnpeiensis]